MLRKYENFLSAARAVWEKPMRPFPADRRKT